MRLKLSGTMITEYGGKSDLEGVKTMRALALAWTCLLLAIPCTAATFTIKADGSGDYPTIQAAINAAQDGDTVLVADGTYTGDGNRDIDFKGKAITVRSANGPENCIIDCQGTEADSHRGFKFHSSEDESSILIGFTITNGYGPNERIWDDSPAMLSAGSAIFFEDSSPKVANCILRDNRGGYYGIGIFCRHSSPIIENCTLTGNTADSGYVIGCVESSSPIINSCDINDNSVAGVGCFRNSDPTISNCNIIGNEGNGISCSSSSDPIILDCVISQNDAMFGSAFRCDEDCNPVISRCIISANTGGYSIRCEDYCNLTINNCIITENPEGGIFCRSEVQISHCTISNNGREGGQPEICLTDRSSASISHSILWRNNKVPIEVRSNCSVDVSYSDVKGGAPIAITADSELNWGPGNFDADPLFGSDYHISSNSPCVNAGDPHFTAEPGMTDIDGEERVINVRTDIGADEFNYEGPLMGLWPRNLEVSINEDQTYQETLSLFIQNIGMGVMNWEIAEDCSWLEAAPTSGESSGEINEIILSIDALSLTAGSYNCELTITSGEALNSPQMLDLTLYVLDADGLLYVPSEYTTIQQAIDSASGDRGDTVIVADGVYTGNGNRDIDFRAKRITVRSANGPAGCIIDCEGTETEPHRGFYFHRQEDANSVLDGFTIRNGYASGDWPDNCGGGILCIDSNPVIMNCILTGNMATADGGGICCEYSDVPIIKNCLIMGNTAQFGGGICAWRSSSSVTNCTVKNNEGRYGAGVYCGKKSPTFSKCTITKNVYTGDRIPGDIHGGGGFYCYRTNLHITNCIISDNYTSGVGGGIYFVGDLAITNCTISKNHSRYGGAIYVWTYSQASIINSILWGNQSEGQNEIHESSPSSSPVYLNHTNIAGGWPGTGNKRTDPLFINAADGNYRLQQNSPCIDAGDNSVIESNSTDLDGKPRIFNAIVDMGAHEFHPNTAPLADAGADQVVYVCEGSTAEVSLNGSGSFDADGDELDYFWFIGDEQIATGVDPNVQLSVGEHIIELIVNDGSEDSEPNAVVITVIGPVETDVDIVPRTINRNNRMKRVMVIIRLPEGVGKGDVVRESFELYAGGLDGEPVGAILERVIGRGNMTRVFVLFDKGEVMNAVEGVVGGVELTVVGRLESGQYIQGSDTVRIVKPRRRRLRWRGRH